MQQNLNCFVHAVCLSEHDNLVMFMQSMFMFMLMFMFMHAAYAMIIENIE